LGLTRRAIEHQLARGTLIGVFRGVTSRGRTLP
jgi:hypothetical protein